MGGSGSVLTGNGREVDEVGMNYYCENCGWSEIVGSPIMCHYNGHRTWRDECCEAWKPKEKETNMVEVVRCKDCKYWDRREYGSYGTCESKNINVCGVMDADWFCADGERRNNDD